MKKLLFILSIALSAGGCKESPAANEINTVSSSLKSKYLGKVGRHNAYKITVDSVDYIVLRFWDGYGNSVAIIKHSK